MRYFITTNSSPGQDLRYDEEKVESSWNFINKIWNISRYVVMNTAELKPEDIILDASQMNFPEKWIMTKLNEMVEHANQFFEKFEFGEAAKLIYNFTWHDFASWYIEMSKLSENRQTKIVLVHVLNTIIKMLHPYMPFVTEEIFQKLPNKEISVMLSNWPIPDEFIFEDTSNKDWFFELIKRIRAIRNDYQVSWSKPIDMFIQTNEKDKLFLEENDQYFIRFLNPKKFEIKEEITAMENTVTVLLPNIQAYIPLGSLVDLEEEINKVETEINRLKGEIVRCEKMLSNPNFLNKAPQAKIDEENDKLNKYQNSIVEAIKRLEEFKE